MFAWMIYVIAVTALLSAAALAAERRARLRRLPSRWLWALAIVASLLLPTIIASVSIQLPSLAASAVPQKIIVLREVTSSTLSPQRWMTVGAVKAATSRSMDVFLQRTWLGVSAILLVVLLANGAYLSWRQRHWAQGTVAATRVYFAPDVGPAVVGLLRPRIVLPTWIHQSSSAVQSAVMAHEQSHLEARDPQLLTMALFLLVLMPWNLPLWWQLRRLRYAIEVDCDARVLEEGHDASHYGKTLIAVGERRSAFIGAVAAMSESKSFLEQRIRIMLQKPSKGWSVAAAALGGLSLVLVAVAAEVGPPNATASTDPAESQRSANNVAVDVGTAVLDRLTGDYQLGPGVVVNVTRDGNRLFARLTGQPKAEIFARSQSEFFYKIVDAQISFESDAQGRTTGLVLHQNGADVAAPRIDAATARDINTATAAKVQSQTATPGSEAALRHLMEGVATGKPNYAEMSPALANAVRKQFPEMTANLAHLGAVQAIEFRGVGNQGWDIYEVRHEHGTSQWRIALDDHGIITGAWFSNGP
jgi:beta-lactamase regulating signal transducer with metallopeptidase domain